MAMAVLLPMSALSGAVAASASPSPWGAAHEIPGFTSLNVGRNGIVRSVSCSSSGNCAAGGSYSTSTDPSPATPLAFVASETNGSWGKAEAVPGLGALHVDTAEVETVSCASAGSCAAGGWYKAEGGGGGFVVDETEGIWGSAQEVPGLGSLDANGSSEVLSVSCTAPGDCAAAGLYNDAQDARQGFVVDETEGIWGSAQEVPGLGALNTGGAAYVTSVSCGAIGDCSAGGYFQALGGTSDGFVVDESDGTWGTAEAIPGLATLSVGGGATVWQVSCAAANCAAVGDYGTGGTHQGGFVVDETDGTWGTAEAIPGLLALNKGGTAFATSVSCAAAGDCSAGGFYKGSVAGDDQRGFVVAESDGSWGMAEEVPGLADLNPNHFGFVEDVSCGAVGNCAAAGYYASPGDIDHGFVVNESDGSWDQAQDVPGPGVAAIWSISCASADHCVGVGYHTTNRGSEVVAASEPGTPPYCSPSGGLTAAVKSDQLSGGDVEYRIVYTNRGGSGCELAGIPGAIGYTTKGRTTLGPAARRTLVLGRGDSIYLGQLGGSAESTYVINLSLASRSRSCRPAVIQDVVIRPIRVPQLLVPLRSPRSERLICRGLRNEAIYGFGPVTQPLT